MGSIPAGLVADVGGGDETPRRVIETPLLPFRQALQTLLGESRALQRHLQKRVGKIGRKRIQTIRTINSHADIISP